MFTTFKEMEAYVLGQNMKKRIALANAHDEPALSAVVHAKRKGVVEGTLIGKKDMIIDMLHEMTRSWISTARSWKPPRSLSSW